MAKDSVKIFIGHSTRDFKEVIGGFKCFLEELSGVFGTDIRVYVCEDRVVSGQDEINERWIKPSDIAFFCFKDRVGEFTREELQVAVKQYTENDFNPQIFVYMMGAEKVDKSLRELKETLEKEYRIFYFDFDEDAVKLRFAQNISQALGGEGRVTCEGRRVLVDGRAVTITAKKLSAIKNNESYSALTKEIRALRDRRTEAEDEGDSEGYSRLTEEINAKINIQIQMERDALSIYERLNNSLKRRDADTDALKALALASEGRIDEALALLPGETLLWECENTMRTFDVGRSLVDRAREDSRRVTEKIASRIEILKMRINREGALSEIISLYEAILKQEDISGELEYRMLYSAFLLSHNRPSEAVRVSEVLLEKLRRADDERTLLLKFMALTSLTNSLLLLSRREEAERCAPRALETAKRLCEKNKTKNLPSLAQANYNYASLCLTASRLSEAEKYCLEAVKLWEGLFSENGDLKSFLGSSYNLLSRIYMNSFKYREAEEAIINSIKLYEKDDELYEDELIMLASAYQELVGLMMNKGKYGEAVAFSLERLSIIESGMKNDREAYAPHLAQASLAIASSYNKLKKYNEALLHIKRAIKIYEGFLRVDPLGTGYQRALALAYDEGAAANLGVNNFDEARNLSERALELKELGREENPAEYIGGAVTSYSVMAEISLAEGDPHTALEHCVCGLKLVQEFAECGAIDTTVQSLLYAILQRRAGVILRESGDLDLAEENLDGAAEVLSVFASLNSVEYVSALDELCTLYSYRIAENATEEDYLKLISSRERLFEYDNARWEELASECGNLGEFYTDAGNYTEAEKYLLRAVKTYEENFNAKNETACISEIDNYNRLVSLYTLTADYDGVERVSMLALGVMEALAEEYPEKHGESLISTYESLISIYSTPPADGERVLQYRTRLADYKKRHGGNL